MINGGFQKISLTMCSFWNTFLWCWSGQHLTLLPWIQTSWEDGTHKGILHFTGPNIIIALKDTKEILIFPWDVKVSYCNYQQAFIFSHIIRLVFTTLIHSFYFILFICKYTNEMKFHFMLLWKVLSKHIFQTQFRFSIIFNGLL